MTGSLNVPLTKGMPVTPLAVRLSLFLSLFFTLSLSFSVSPLSVCGRDLSPDREFHLFVSALLPSFPFHSFLSLLSFTPLFLNFFISFFLSSEEQSKSTPMHHQSPDMSVRDLQPHLLFVFIISPNPHNPSLCITLLH